MAIPVDVTTSPQPNPLEGQKDQIEDLKDPRLLAIALKRLSEIEQGTSKNSDTQPKNRCCTIL